MEVDTGALVRNFRTIRDVAGRGLKWIPMVKADGYGLGLLRAAQALQKEKPFGFGVATADEALVLLSAGIQEPVMVYPPLTPDATARVADAGAIPSISSLETLSALRQRAATLGKDRPVPFQLEVDTGMGRSGFPLADATGGWWPAVQEALGRHLSLFGVFTHLHSAGETDAGETDPGKRDASSFQRQVARFESFVRAAEGLDPSTLLHFANSAGCLKAKSSLANAARPGIFLYGGRAAPRTTEPEPVAALRARISLIRDVPAGTSLGYGATYRAAAAEQWATVSIGYGDGLPRILGNRARAIVRGCIMPVVGRISMDMTVVRLARAGVAPSEATSASVGDMVTFIGSEGSSALSLDEVAELAGTIGYEILTGFSSRLPRIAANSGHS